MPLSPNIANPSSEYELICSPIFNLQAIYNLIVYIFRQPHIIIPTAPPKTPTWEIAEGVAKIPIPIKHLNMLKYVYATLVFLTGPAPSFIGKSSSGPSA